MIPAVRLATHEIDEMVKVKTREARLKRLQQVREQSSQFAKRLREARESKEEKLTKEAEAKLQKQFDAEMQTLIQEMEQEALYCMENLGSAHERARQENEENYEDERQQKISLNRKKAQRLGKDALKELQVQQLETSAEKNRRMMLRKQALDTESVRSKYVASLPPVKVLASHPPPEDPPKVIRFDKSTLFQTEYVIKEKLVEPILIAQDAREAALLSEIEEQEIAKRKEEQKQEDLKRMVARGKDAAVRQKTHNNYLRLLEELDKMEKEPDNNWDVESTLTNAEQSNRSISPRPISVLPSSESSNLVDRFENTEQSKETIGMYLPIEKEVVSTLPLFQSVRLPPPPPLSEKDSQQLNEIGQLLKELRDEQERWMASDHDQVVKEVDQSDQTEQQTSSYASTSSSGGVAVFSDDDLKIRFNVSEKSSSSSDDTECRKNLANVLNAIRKERARLDGILGSNQPVKRPGILRRPPSLPDSCTSTPVAKKSAQPTQIGGEEDERQKVLKHYIQKLLQMKREEVKNLSVSSSSSVMSTPKPVAGSIHRPVAETKGNVSIRADFSSSRSSSSAYDSPATDQSSSRISNGSSLPLGAEASAYRRSDAGKWDSNGDVGGFTLGPLLNVYNDVYQAYNQRLRLVTQERPIAHDGRPLPWQRETLTESSFMSLTLSATSTEPSSLAVSRQRQFGHGDASSFSVELSLSSSSSTNTSQPASVRDWDKISADSRISTSTTSISNLKSIGSSSTTSSQDISMPDVDEALRRLGMRMPSLQPVLRR